MVRQQLKASLKNLLIRAGLVPKSLGASWIIASLIEQQRTMVSYQRLRELEKNCSRVSELPGAFVECGVAKGGCLAFMSYLAPKREIWGFDSFQGMPPTTAEDEGEGDEWVDHICSGNEGAKEVERTFCLCGLNPNRAKIVAGWFEDTLERSQGLIGEIAILRLDNDFYRSTKFCLETLYDSVVSGGVVIIDDYFAFKGCRKAVDEFRAERGVKGELITTQANSEAYWIK